MHYLAQCIAGLSHTRAGVADAMVTSGVVSRLLRLLLHDNGLLRMAASQALGKWHHYDANGFVIVTYLRLSLSFSNVDN